MRVPARGSSASRRSAASHRAAGLRLPVLCAFAVAAALAVTAFALPAAASAASTLSGVLRDASTNAAITSADVPMALEKQQPGGEFALVENQLAVAGAYSFSGLDAGQYRLVQLGSSPFSYFPPAQNPGPALTVDGATDLTADWPLVRTGFGQGDSKFTGRIVDQASGSPIVGPTFWVSLEQKSPSGSWTHIIDSFESDGTYAFGQLGQGEYRVRLRGAPPAGYQRRVSAVSPSVVLDGTTTATHDFELWREITTVPASSAWSLALAGAMAAGVLVVRRRWSA